MIAIAAGQAILFLIESSRKSKGTPSFLERSYKEVDSTSNSYPFLDQVVIETLRLTAHTIGAIRKVVSPDGWTFQDQIQTPTGTKTVHYNVPFGNYIGVSHIVPHHDKNK